MEKLPLGGNARRHQIVMKYVRQYVWIDDVQVTIASVEGGRVMLSIDAPRATPITDERQPSRSSGHPRAVRSRLDGSRNSSDRRDD